MSAVLDVSAYPAIFFAIVTLPPASSNKTFKQNIIEADSVDGFAMLINKKKFEENNFFG